MPNLKTPPKRVWLWRWLQSILILIGGSVAVFVALLSMAVISSRLRNSPLLQPLRAIIHNITPQQNMLISPQIVSTSQVEESIAQWRAQENIATLSAHLTLEKYARLLTLEIEDQESLAIENSQDVLYTLTSQPPKKVEILSLFAPESGKFNLAEELMNEAVLLREDLTEVGIATRSATFKSVRGTIITIALSSTFPEKEKPQTQQQTTQTRTVPTFTGEDLWAAVQAYRRAHGLPEFAMSTELCTVASIRVNEQLTLGRLDNHDGFGPRSDEFFAKNPGWTSINENLASGYQTATQTVEWGWDQSLGHKALIQSREFPKACTAANSGFAVLITGR